MSSSHRARAFGVFALALAVLLVVPSGCTETEIVYRTPDFTEDVPDGAGGFLGYSSVQDARTVCGNCHIGKQSEWEGTAHADAWASLPGPDAEPFFSVSSMGNVVTDENVGWVSTGNERYQDVQCESCHGPGVAHVRNPDADETKPQAPLAAGVDLSMGCGECHSGEHQPYLEEWAGSNHGDMNAFPQGRPECQECHEGRGALDAMGVRTTYLEEDDEELMDLSCGVCHDPHDNAHDGQLRLSVTAPSLDRNLCMRCHQQRGTPDPASIRGPHAPEGPLLLGQAGWWPPNLDFEPGEILGTHGTEANPGLCVTCHMGEDAGTGHTFEATPCTDADGNPLPGEECDLSERSFVSCTDGCHGTEASARSALITARTRIDRLVDELEELLAEVPEEELDEVLSTAWGADFNRQLATEFDGSVAHNPFLLEALLIGSIQQVEEDYEVSASSALSLDFELEPHP